MINYLFEIIVWFDWDSNPRPRRLGTVVLTITPRGYANSV